MNRIKAYTRPVWADSNGREWNTKEEAEASQTAIDRLNFANEVVADFASLPSVKACCTRDGLKGITGETLIRTMLQDLDLVRDICNAHLRKAKKLDLISSDRVVAKVLQTA